MHALRHVLWIGGPPCAGKTAVATRIARRHGLRWYCADTRTWQHRDRATVAAVEELFAEAMAEGPRAATRAERQALLREANRAIAAQVRGYYARPWADGDAEQVVREFSCECGNTACFASVHLPVAALMSGPVLAQGHH